MKYIYTLLAVLLVAPCFAQEEESHLFIAPGRETFLHFPSQILGDKYNLRVYLPEGAQSKSARYPVIYLLGWDQDSREEIKNYLKNNQALVVWMNFSEDDLAQDNDTVVRFFAQELLPYIDTNYFTFDVPEKRILAAYGKSAAQTAVELLQKPDLFRFMALKNPADALTRLTQLPAGARVMVTGKQQELARSQRALEEAGAQFGAQFVLHYDNGTNTVLGNVNLPYFFAQEKDLRPVKLQATLSEKTLPLDAQKPVYLHVGATLKNKMVSSFIPQTLRISPPFLEWDETNGKLTLRAGAEPGKIKISAEKDKLRFKTALKLKKP